MLFIKPSGVISGFVATANTEGEQPDTSITPLVSFEAHALFCLEFTFQKIGLVKYDAFHEMGGKLSFSLALLNETDDGFVMNAVHSREGCYTYIKEIIAGKCVIILSEEEKEALDMAMQYKL